MCNEELFIIILTLLALVFPFLVFPFSNRVDKKNYKKISNPKVKEHCFWCGARCEVYKKVHNYSSNGEPCFEVAKLCPSYGFLNTDHENMSYIGLYDSLEELLGKYVH